MLKLLVLNRFWVKLVWRLWLLVKVVFMLGMVVLVSWMCVMLGWFMCSIM